MHLISPRAGFCPSRPTRPAIRVRFAPQSADI